MYARTNSRILYQTREHKFIKFYEKSNLYLQDRSNALSSCAGLFIGSHIGFDFPGVWIHFDMAYPVHCVC